MTKHTRKPRAVSATKIAEIADRYVTPTGEAPIPQPEPKPEFVELPGVAGITGAMDAAEAEARADHEADHGPGGKRGKSVVPLGYKVAYARRAVAHGHTSKAARRQNSDWLALELLAECVPDGKTFDMGRFVAICEANGIANPLERWPNRNNGWEGRLRMSGAIVLRGIVAKSGVFRTPEGEVRLADLPEAAAFLARWGQQG